MINYTVLLPILLIYILVTGAVCFVKKMVYMYICAMLLLEYTYVSC